MSMVKNNNCLKFKIRNNLKILITKTITNVCGRHDLKIKKHICLKLPIIKILTILIANITVTNAFLGGEA